MEIYIYLAFMYLVGLGYCVNIAADNGFLRAFCLFVFSPLVIPVVIGEAMFEIIK